MRRPTPSRLRPGLTDRTDAHLLRLAREGDPRAYEAIVARYREPLRRSCARIVPDRAEDAVQQTLLSAWLALERGAEVRELRPWLYSIARNAAIDQARGVRSELVELGPEVPGGEDPAHVEGRRREVAEVLEAVAALPDRQRRALVDTALHGRPTEAVAGDLGLTGGALRQLVHRARTTVRAAVPSVGFPVPAWLASMLGEEGARGGALLLTSGSGAAVLAKTTATVATFGAVLAGGISLDGATERRGAARSQVASVAAPTSAGAASPAAGVVRGATLLAGTPLLRRASISTPGGGSVGDAAAPVTSTPSDRDGSGHDPAAPGRAIGSPATDHELRITDRRGRDAGSDRDRRTRSWAPTTDTATDDQAGGSRDGGGRRDRSRSEDRQRPTRGSDSSGSSDRSGSSREHGDDASTPPPASTTSGSGTGSPPTGTSGGGPESETTAPSVAPGSEATSNEASGEVDVRNNVEAAPRA